MCTIGTLRIGDEYLLFKNKDFGREIFEDQVVPRHTISLSLTFDHRVVDGALAARFLGRLKEVLETPGLLG